MAICSTVLNPGPSFAAWLDYHLRRATLMLIFMDDPQERPLFEAITGGKRGDVLFDGAADGGDRTPSGLRNRQDANTQSALAATLSCGISWLLHIDSDEIFYDGGDFSWRNLTNVGHVTFVNHEAVPLKDGESANCFADCTLFKVNGRMEFSAYGNGKSAVRVTPGVRPWAAHAFIGYDGEHRDAQDPMILHYPTPTFESWVAKFTHHGKFSNYWFDDARQPIPLRFMLESRDQVHAALDSGDWDAARRYFEAQIPDEETCLQLLQTGALRRYHPLGWSAGVERRSCMGVASRRIIGPSTVNCTTSYPQTPILWHFLSLAMPSVNPQRPLKTRRMRWATNSTRGPWRTLRFRRWVRWFPAARPCPGG